MALEADADLVCQPGVGWMTINETLRSKGQFLYVIFLTLCQQVRPGIPLFFPVQ
jgi:hypothetical protein